MTILKLYKRIDKFLQCKLYFKFFLCLLCVSLVLSCKKNKDYREQFTGDYNFKVNSFGGAWGSTWKDTIFYETGNVILGTNNNTVKISIGNFSIEPDMAEDGTLSNCRCDFHYTFSGKFHSYKNVTLIFDYHGLGGGSHEEYNGER